MQARRLRLREEKAARMVVRILRKKQGQAKLQVCNFIDVSISSIAPAWSSRQPVIVRRHGTGGGRGSWFCFPTRTRVTLCSKRFCSPLDRSIDRSID